MRYRSHFPITTTATIVFALHQPASRAHCLAYRCRIANGVLTLHAIQVIKNKRHTRTPNNSKIDGIFCTFFSVAACISLSSKIPFFLSPRSPQSTRCDEKAGIAGACAYGDRPGLSLIQLEPMMMNNEIDCFAFAIGFATMKYLSARV